MKYSSYTTGILEIDIQHTNIAFLLTELAKEGLEKEESDYRKVWLILRNAKIRLSIFDFEEKWAQTNNKNFDADHLGIS